MQNFCHGWWDFMLTNDVTQVNLSDWLYSRCKLSDVMVILDLRQPNSPSLAWLNWLRSAGLEPMTFSLVCWCSTFWAKRPIWHPGPQVPSLHPNASYSSRLLAAISAHSACWLCLWVYSVISLVPPCEKMYQALFFLTARSGKLGEGLGTRL